MVAIKPESFASLNQSILPLNRRPSLCLEGDTRSFQFGGRLRSRASASSRTCSNRDKLISPRISNGEGSAKFRATEHAFSFAFLLYPLRELVGWRSSKLKLLPSNV